MSAKENSNTKCTGYVDVVKKYENKNEYRYTPYIKCGSLYETKKIADYILSHEKVVTTGEGLYQSGNYYYYRGEYPNNYIKLGDGLYRIMGITEDGNLKLISTQTNNRFYWDNRFNSEKQSYVGINDFKKSRLKQALELLYTGSEENVYIEDTVKSYIVEHDFCTGKRSLYDKNIYSNDECNEITSLKVGLINLGEYYKVSISSGNPTL